MRGGGTIKNYLGIVEKRKKRTAFGDNGMTKRKGKRTLLSEGGGDGAKGKE